MPNYKLDKDFRNPVAKPEVFGQVDDRLFPICPNKQDIFFLRKNVLEDFLPKPCLPNGELHQTTITPRQIPPFLICYVKRTFGRSPPICHGQSPAINGRRAYGIPFSFWYEEKVVTAYLPMRAHNYCAMGPL